MDRFVGTVHTHENDELARILSLDDPRLASEDQTLIWDIKRDENDNENAASLVTPIAQNLFLVNQLNEKELRDVLTSDKLSIEPANSQGPDLASLIGIIESLAVVAGVPSHGHLSHIAHGSELLSNKQNDEQRIDEAAKELILSGKTVASVDLNQRDSIIREHFGIEEDDREDYDGDDLDDSVEEEQKLAIARDVELVAEAESQRMPRTVVQEIPRQIRRGIDLGR